MQVRFRLAEILKEYRDTGRGVIKKISDETNLERHQVSALLKNEVQYLSLNSLGAICDYLIRVHHVNRYELPGRLFALEPEDFWSFLSVRRLLIMSFGVRLDMHGSDVLWIPASDSYFQGELLHELYDIEQQSPSSASALQMASLRPGQKPVLATDQAPRFEQYMVHSCSARKQETDLATDRDFQRMKEEAANAFKRFHESAGDKALVCLGSVKSNGLCELTIARAFSTPPWMAQENLASPRERACPFFFRLRENDVQLPSCHAGKRLPADLAKRFGSAEQPGIYFEREPDTWDMVPSSDDREAALIFYTYQPPEGVVELVMGGFSSRGTFFLAKQFRKIVRSIWPPTYDTPSLRAGVFIVDFHLKSKWSLINAERAAGDLSASIPQLESCPVISLPHEVLAHRLAKAE